MSVTWTLTRERIADKALEKCQALASGGTPDAADRALALEALDSILKELPWHGYSWPKTVSGQAALTFTAATQTVSLPADYYGNAIITYLDASLNEIGLPLVALLEWNRIVRKTDTAAYPIYGFLDNFNVLWLWPIQTANVTAKISYQKVIDDTAASTSPNLSSAWIRGLVTGVAAEIGDEFSVQAQKIDRWDKKWAYLRNLGIQNQSYPEVDRVTVCD